MSRPPHRWRIDGLYIVAISFVILIIIVAALGIAVAKMLNHYFPVQAGVIFPVGQNRDFTRHPPLPALESLTPPGWHAKPPLQRVATGSQAKSARQSPHPEGISA